jgi:predicted NUDIX family NTP pyrophosphohydrolase
MSKQSAGILLYRLINKQPEFFLVHPGGPFNRNRDLGAWSIPKGEFTDEEDGLAAALREFQEETSQTITGDFKQLKAVKQKNGKTVYAWAVEGDVDTNAIVSNTIQVEYPYKSGKWITIPEVDRGEWFDAETAKLKMISAQAAFVDELVAML